ncbi:MAG: ribbon-helix-helix protein, CopG family [Tepidiformaceae bacterium]
MIRTQVLLSEQDLAAVRCEAKRLGISMSEVIRRQLQPLKDESVTDGEDPFLALEGFLGSEPDGATDVSANVDHYLYGGPKRN